MNAQIIVPADSSITELSQLAGKEVVFPGPEAMVAYKFPMAQLMARKIDAKPVFGGNMDGALAQMFSGKVVASGVNSQLAEGYAKREGKTYRVLWSSPPVHDLALMAASKVPEKVQKAVAQAFIGMSRDPKGREVLAQASAQVGLTSEAFFVASDGSEYATYRDFYRSAPASLR